MTELLAVVVIIGILAAMASPMFINMMRDRRIYRAAATFVDVLRQARTRAMGRGAATDVIWDSQGTATTSASGTLELREAIVSGSPLPTTSCLTTDWSTGSLTSRQLFFFDVSNGRQELTRIQYLDDTGATQAYGEICFSPRGRTFQRFAMGGNFNLLTGVPTFVFTNARFLAPPAQVPRVVNVLPNGVARLTL